MTKEEMLEGNKLIATFIGLKFYRRPKFFQVILGDVDELKWKDSYGEIQSINNLKYHSSWDWIIPVVIKINNLNLPGHQLADVNLTLNRLDIAELWKSVVKFIKWYKLLELQK